MQRKLRQTACVSVASATLLLAACATEVQDPIGEPISSSAGTSAEGGKGGGAGAGTGGTNGGAAGAGGSSVSGAAQGGVGASAPGGGAGGMGGANSGGVAGGGGRAGAGGGGGRAGAGGGGSGGRAGGGGGGAGGAAGVGGGTSGTSGAAGTGGSGGGTVNLITNSGFESNTTGWSVFGGSGTIATSTAQAHSGTRSLLITGRTQTYQGPQYSVLSVVTPGASYNVSLWARLAASTPTGSLTVTLHYTCSGGSNAGDNYFRWVETAAASSTSWTHFTGAQTFPACGGGGTLSAASLYVESPTATLSYYIDDVVLSVP